MRKSLFMVIMAGGLGSLSLAASAQRSNAFTAQQCVDYALKNSTQVKNALLDIQIQQQTNREYTSAAYPRLSGSIGSNYNPQVATQVFPNFIALATYGVLEDEGVKDGNGNAIKTPTDIGLIQAQFGTKYSAVAGAELSQLLFDGQVFVGLRARKTALDFAQAAAAVTEENIKANLLKVYYQLIAAQKQLSTIDANAERIEQLLKDTRELFKNGFAEKLDIDKVSITLINIRTEKEKLQRQLETGLLGLKLLMGMPVQETLVLTDTTPELELPKDVLEAAYSYEDRKEVQQLRIAERLGQYNVQRYQLSKIPTLNLYSQYYRNALRNSFNFLDGKQKWFPSSVIGIRLNVSLFEGMARNAHIQKARYELQQTRNNLELLQRSIDHDVQKARLQYRNAMESMNYQKQNMELADKVYTLTKKKYEQG
ncbi:MAG: TolC family protein, partial [Chitinophagaceae bacterium]